MKHDLPLLVIDPSWKMVDLEISKVRGTGETFDQNNEIEAWEVSKVKLKADSDKAKSEEVVRMTLLAS